MAVRRLLVVLTVVFQLGRPDWVAPQLPYGARVPVADVLRPSPRAEWDRTWWSWAMNGICANGPQGAAWGNFYYWDDEVQNCKYIEIDH